MTRDEPGPGRVIFRVGAAHSVADLEMGRVLVPALRAARWQVTAEGFQVEGQERARIGDWFQRRSTPSVTLGWDRGKSWRWLSLTDPDIPGLGAWLLDHPQTRVIVPDEEMRSALLESHADCAANVRVIAYPVPDPFFRRGDATSAFEVTRRLHLERRPRIVCAGSLQDGRGLTQILDAVRSILTHDGELVLLNGLAVRAALAPVVGHLGLAGAVVFAPPLTAAEMAGLFLGADVLVSPELPRGYPYWLLYAAVAGLPSVALDSALARQASNRAALMVRPDRPDAWPGAIRAALDHRELRENMIGRGLAIASRHDVREVAETWGHVLALPSGDPG